MQPFAIELKAVNVVQSQLKYTLYFLDRTNRIVEGNLNDLEKHLQQAKEHRAMGHQYSDLLAQQLQIQAQIHTLNQQIEADRNELSTLEKTAEAQIKQKQTDRPKPEYDDRLAQTMTERERKGFLIGSVAAAGFGLLVFMASDRAIGKIVGSGLFLGGGATTSIIYGKKTDDSEEAASHRALKQQAKDIESALEQQEQKSKKSIDERRKELQQSLQEQHQLKQQKVEVDDRVVIAEMMQRINQQMEDGILYGEPDLMASLEILISKRSRDGDLAKGFAGAAAIGLMVIGAFAGVNL